MTPKQQHLNITIMSNKEETKLIPISDLVPDVVEQWSLEQYNANLNRQPPKQWLMKHPLASGVFYLPIDKVEYLLRKIFKDFKIEVLRESTMFNAVYVAVRVHYFHPILKEWRFHDGVGSWDVQTDKGESVADLAKIKSMAVAKALPAAESAAIKDACDKFGDLFGANINRKGTLQFEPEENLKNRAEQRIDEMIDNAKSVDDLQRILDSATIPDKYKDKFEQKMEDFNAQD